MCEGGNAADAAIAAALVSIRPSPRLLTGSGELRRGVARGRRDPVTIDGNVAMPGFGLLEEQRGRGARQVFVEYGGGLRCARRTRGVATPGAFAALGAASARYGRLPWSTLVAARVQWARDGFRCPRLHMNT